MICRFLWIRSTDLPRYVQKDTYHTVLDDKSGYDHILLTEESHTFFGIQWGGWYLRYNILPFVWKISSYVYHTTGLLASSFSGQLVYLVYYTLTTDITENSKFRLIKVNTAL